MKRNYQSPVVRMVGLHTESTLLTASDGSSSWFGWLFTSTSRTNDDKAEKDSVGAVQKPYLWD